MSSRADGWTLMLAGFATSAYALLAVTRHATFRSTGFDLGLFDQVVWQYSRFQAPGSTLRDVDLILGDHLSPVLALLAPLYWLWSDPVMLLLAQSALVASPAFPIRSFAARRVGRAGARLLVLAYLLFGGVQEAIWFDFHEVAFAPLLIAVAVDAADRRRWRLSLLAALGLLLVKEDLALVVVAIGLWYGTLGQPGLAAATVAIGVTWFVLATSVVIPALSDSGAYGYWTYSSFGDGPVDAFGGVVREPWRLVEVAFDEDAKVRTAVFLFGSFLGLTLLSPLMLLTLPLLAERLLSDNAKLWSLEDHYSLVIAPVLVLGAADGLARLGRRLGPVQASRMRLVPLTTGVIALIAIALTPAFPLASLLRPSAYRIVPAYREAREALRSVPPDASIAAGNRLIPHLSQREEVRLFGAPGPVTDWVVVASSDRSPEGIFPSATVRDFDLLLERRLKTHRIVFDRAGLLVLRRPDR